MPYEERRSHLKGWNFNCTCSLCSAPTAERAQSDKRRYKLRDILSDLVSYKLGGPSLSDMLDETLYLVEKEDMGFLVGSFYAGFAWAYLASNDLGNARKHGLLAGQMAERYAQEDQVAQILGNFWQALKEKTNSRS